MSTMTDSAAPLREVPGDGGLPLLGHSFKLLLDLDTFVHERYEKYGEVSWGAAFGMRFISLFGPDANQFVFQNRGDLFASSAWEHFLAKFFHRGLMLLDFDEHRIHRRIMQGAFTRDALLGYLGVLTPGITAGLAAWQPRSGFLIFDHLKSLTLDLASEVFIGHTPGAEAERINKAFLATVQAATGIIRFPLPGTRWHAGVVGRALLEDFFRRELPEKRQSSGDDLFSRLCRARTEDGEAFSDEDIVNHMIFVLMAAHDTSTITLSNMVYWLAREPAWQDRLREESRALGTHTPDFEQLAKLETMGWVMKEALRLCPPVPGLPRQAVRDCEYKGFRIPAGSFVSISPWFTHTSAHYWKEPQRFDPERFSEARAEDRAHPFKWVPFGGGAHKCIGLHFGEMEVKAILHQMLLRFRWSVPEGYVMKQDFTSLPIPKDRLPVTLERI
ncbi:cytochrome P450 [Solimonas sp. K1W22B-7]|uniref:cytochrome P450 n=1 Tax=Solimonas sp. K1W22B-7 TaxID=2303331 RepID=UPI000E33157E|nr:cytochrome P450 [Solimonas sp. K1W22B-7]AXQ30645.1 cytochrome P450 [Solimonas sp. K1W22B-7]